MPASDRRLHEQVIVMVVALFLVFVLGTGGMWVFLRVAGTRQAEAQQAAAAALAAERQAAARQAQADADAARAVEIRAQEAEARRARDGLPVYPSEPFPNDPVREVLDRSAADLDAGSLREKPELEANLRATLAASYLGRGLFDQAEAQANKALELRSRTLGEEQAEVAKTKEFIERIRAARRSAEQKAKGGGASPGGADSRGGTTRPGGTPTERPDT